MKQCKKCKTIKNGDAFYKKVSNADGLRDWCKDCEFIIRSPISYEARQLAKKGLKKCKICGKILQSNCENFYSDKKTKCGLRPECKKCNVVKYKDSIAKTGKMQRSKIKKGSSKHILNNARNRLWYALRSQGVKKEYKTIELLGCSIEHLKSHLSKQFVYGMTFENYGKWHIDHIIPCNFFDFRIKEDLKKCFHYSNLQPLWARDNILKGDKIQTI